MAEFKIRSTNEFTVPFEPRKIYETCQKCLPNARKFTEDPRINSFGFSNILTTPRQPTPTMPGANLRSNAGKFLSAFFFRITAWLLDKIFRRIFTSIQYHKGQIQAIKKVLVKNDERIPIVYVPVHRSHLDYLIISYVLYMTGTPPPLVASGDNLNISFFGWIMPYLGAFYIRRRLDPVNGIKDHTYRDQLRSYMVENLALGHSMEFFVEGGRSRTGKSLRPKAGLLSVIVNAIIDGSCTDAYIVPVGISYDRLVEGNFNDEQLGASKTKESLTSALKATWQTLHSNYGSARVDFCAPFSLREYLESKRMLQRTDSQNSECDSPSRSISPGELSTGDMNRCASHYGLDMVATGDKRKVIRQLADHITYEATNISAVMATQAVAFLFLHKFRNGATLMQLASGLDWLRDRMNFRDRCLGYSGESKHAVLFAMKLLGDEIVKVECLCQANLSVDSDANNNQQGDTVYNEIAGLINTISNDLEELDDTIIFKPVLNHFNILTMNYYSNHVTSTFIMESIISVAFESLAKSQTEYTGVHTIYSSDIVNGKKIKVPRNDLIEWALELCDILQMEYIFVKPCEDLEDSLRSRLESMILEGFFTAEDPHVNTKRLNYYEIDDDSDYDDGFCDHPAFIQYIVLEARNRSIDDLSILKKILSPLIESYYSVFRQLDQLINCPMRESAFVAKLISNGLEKIRNNNIAFPESVASENYLNALRLLHNWNVIEVEQGLSKVISLSDEFDSEEGVRGLQLRVQKFD